jgi:hypothetical protein
MKRRFVLAGAGGAAGLTLAAAKPAPPAPVPATGLNVKAFGAMGDGVTDDSDAIQAALNQAGAAGPLYFPDGQYLMSKGAVSSTANITVSGQSWNAELIRAPGNSAGLLQIYGEGTLVNTLTLNGNGRADVGQGAELILGGAYCRADRVQVVNSRTIGINVSANHCIVSASIISGLANPNIQSYGIWAINYNTGVMIRDNFITGTGIDGIGISGNGYQVIGNYLANCHAYTGTGGGQLTVYDNSGATRNGVILGNTIGEGHGTLSCGMELNGYDTTVSGNNISYQKFLGIVATGTGYLISDNTISNSGQSGTTIGSAISINANTSNFHISGNRLIDNQARPTQSYGVVVDSTDSNFYSIVGNLFSGNVDGAINDAGTGLNKLIADNIGIDDVIPSISAGGTITLPLNPVVQVTGTANVTRLSGPAWTGRTVTLITDSALHFYVGGNLANDLSVKANTPVTALFNGTAWYLR